MIATAITAVATSASAYIAWRKWRGAITANWDFTWDSGEDRSLRVECVVYNFQDSALRPLQIKVLKPSSVTVQTDSREKHESWPANAHYLNGEILPNGKTRYLASVRFDWQELADNPSRRLVTRAISDTPLRIQITLASKSSLRRKIKLTAQIKLPRKMIENMAKKASE